MKGLRVGLAFNLRREAGRDGPEDAEAEYDSWSTVSALAEALSFGGRTQVVLLPFGPDLRHLVEQAGPDVVFNIAEGVGGRSRELLTPAVLEMCGTPYTGADPVALGVAMDKALAKVVVRAAGVPTTPSWVVTDRDDLVQLIDQLPYPVFVKPVAEGSSKGVRAKSRSDSPEQLRAQVEWVLDEYHEPALIEPFLSGREFSVGVLGNDRLRCLPVLEVRPVVPPQDPAGFIYCFHTKSGNLERFLCPAPVTPDLDGRLRRYAMESFRALGLRDVARVDFRLDASGDPQFLEVNPLPGLSSVSLLTVQGEAAGLGLEALVATIIAEAAIRWLATEPLEPAVRERIAALLPAVRSMVAESRGGGCDGARLDGVRAAH